MLILKELKIIFLELFSILERKMIRNHRNYSRTIKALLSTNNKASRAPNMSLACFLGQRKKELACLTTYKPPNQNRFIVETNLPLTYKPYTASVFLGADGEVQPHHRALALQQQLVEVLLRLVADVQQDDRIAQQMAREGIFLIKL